MSNASGIDIVGVSKRYGKTTVVDEVSLHIPRGGVTSIIGPNGAGKSTLLGMMSRLLPVDDGVVTVDGLDVTRASGDVLARKMSILRQENVITARLTVEDLVTFGRYPHSKGRPTVEDREHIDRAIDYLDVGALRGRFLDQLSGGQRQRAFVAMVLAQDTDYMLLDEPLNNLDMKHAVSMMKLVQRMARELDKTIVVVIHDINFASCYSDRIVAMREGALVHSGTPGAMMQPQVMNDVYDMDFPIESIGGNRLGIYFAADRAEAS